MGWMDKLKGAQESCSHPRPYEETEELEGKKDRIYSVVTERCKQCRNTMSRKKNRVI